MTPQGKREIVIEYERIQLIRKRARTEVAHCQGCGTVTDFVRVADVASLFEIGVDDAIEFASGNGCHYRKDSGPASLCLSSLLARLKTNAISNGIKLIRE